MKLVFDSTFSEHGVSYLRGFFSSHKVPRPLFTHIHEIGARDQRDDIWFPRLMVDDCIIITGDAGRDAPRLPLLCRQGRKTHIILSGTLQQECQFTKWRAIVVLWPHILKIDTFPKGTRFQIQIVDANHEHFKLVPKS